MRPVAALSPDQTLSIEGGGWGHGHGMSQYGARAQADEGRGWRTILHSYYTDVNITDEGNPTVRVLLDSADDLVAGGPEAYTVAWADGTTIRRRGDANPFTRVRATGEGVTVARGSSPTGPWTQVASGTQNVSIQPDGPIIGIWLHGRLEYYRGALEGNRRGANTMYAINVLSMDSYLYGVVPREMPASWPQKALRAQAVAARSYSAWKRAAAGPSASYHICATTACQVYRGYGLRDDADAPMQVLESASSNAAVDATTGMMMTTGGDPIFAEFHSSSGGYTAQGSRPYLAPVPDPWDAEYSPYHRWNTGVTVGSIVNRWPQLGSLTAIDDIKRDGKGPFGGHVTSMTLRGTDADVTVSGETFRSSMALRSTLFSIALLDAVPDGQPEEVTVAPGATATAVVHMRNTGTIRWPVGGDVRLSTWGPRNRTSAFQAAGWDSSRRVTPVTADLSDEGGKWIGPGEIAEFRFDISAPSAFTSGTYTETFRLHKQGESFFGDPVTVPVRIAFDAASHLGGSLVQNGSFEAADASAPAGWMSLSGSAGSVQASGGVDGDAALSIPGDPDRVQAFRARMAQAGPAGDRYVFGVWNRSEGTGGSRGRIDAKVKVTHTDGTVAVHRLSFPKRSHDWTYRSTAFETASPYTRLEAYVYLRHQTGRAWFDRVTLTPTLVADGGFDDDITGWSLVNAGADDGPDGARAHGGTAALRIAGATDRWVYASQQIDASGPAGRSFRVSGWNRTVGSDPEGGAVQIRALVRYTDGTSDTTFVEFPRAPHAWGYGETVLTAAKPYKRLNVLVRYAAQTGQAWFDDVAVEPTDATPVLSANAGFELGSPLPGQWIVKAPVPDAGASASSVEGDASLKIKGAADAVRSARQTLPLAGPAGDVFRLSAANKTYNSSRRGGAVRVLARAFYADGTSAVTRLDFSKRAHGWTTKATTFTVAKDYVRIDLFAKYVDQSGAAWFDDVALQRA